MTFVQDSTDSTAAGNSGWARYPVLAQRQHSVARTDDPLPWHRGADMLPRGEGRSYGDSALAHGGLQLLMTRCDRVRAFDADAGLITAEGGTTLGAIARVALSRGWYPPAMPGTRHVTLGGAIANDIHGKNHLHAGAFGAHVRSIELRRSDRDGRFQVEPGDPLFGATIGGLGLTGVIVAATIALARVPGPGVAARAHRFDGWERYFDLVEELAPRHAYSVAWIAPKSGARVRGTLKLGDAAPGPESWCREPGDRGAIPFDLPAIALGRTSIAAFEAVYARASAWGDGATRVVPVWSFMHPLDGFRHVNRIYGSRGFVQYHFVVPRDAQRRTIPAIVGTLVDRGLRVFLPVVKRFGPAKSQGWLSFPMEGTSVTLDLPWQGEPMLAALDEADARVADAGGRVYVAKDARMSGPVFRRYYPRWEELEHVRDPALLSRFWHRVTA